MKSAHARPRNARRILKIGGLGFIVVGGIVAIVLNIQQQPPSAPVLPVILSGRVVSRVPGAKGGGLQVQLLPAERALDRAVFETSTKTNHFGEFRFRGHLQGVVHVSLMGDPLEPWTFRPVQNVRVPASEPVAIELIEGAAVTGRVVRDGKPVPSARLQLKLGLKTHAVFLKPYETASDGKGFFAFRHIVEDAEGWICAPPGSLPDQGVLVPHPLRTGRDTTTVELGDIEVRRSHTLAGRVICADGKAPEGSFRVEAWQRYPSGSLSSKMDQSGRFEIRGLPDGLVHVWVASEYPNRSWLRFRLSPSNKCVDPHHPGQLAGQLDRDITDLTVLYEEGEQTRPSEDPSLDARFKEAVAGPITGVPPSRAGKK